MRCWLNSYRVVGPLLQLNILACCRSLRCHRTRIHKNLFVAISVQIAMRILMVADQYIARKTGGEVAGASSGSSGALYDTVSNGNFHPRDSGEKGGWREGGGGEKGGGMERRVERDGGGGGEAREIDARWRRDEK